MKAGLLFQPNGFWIGVHYSFYDRRFCINLIPCITIWITLRGGKIPERGKEKPLDFESLAYVARMLGP